MKKVITTVGTSLFVNYFDKKDLGYFLNEWENRTPKQLREVKHVKEDASEALERIKNNLKGENASAEIASLLAIQKEIKKQIEVYLICTDTALSVMAAECIEHWFQINGHKGISFGKTEEVQGLQLRNKEQFEKEGLVQLVRAFRKVANDGFYWDDCIFNITGGYKALIPYSTIIAQIKKRPIYYIFEESDVEKYKLIHIPNLPVSFDLSFFEAFWDNFSLLSDGKIADKSDFEDSTKFLEAAESCVEIDGNDCCLNGIGAMLWEDYSSQYFVYYATYDVEKAIEENTFKHLNNSFCKQEIREKASKPKPEPEKNHTVYGDNRHEPRIFYFEKNGKIVIYKTFIHHNDEYESYLNSLRKAVFDKDKILKEAKQRKIKIKK